MGRFIPKGGVNNGEEGEDATARVVTIVESNKTKVDVGGRKSLF